MIFPCEAVVFTGDFLYHIDYVSAQNIEKHGGGIMQDGKQAKQQGRGFWREALSWLIHIAVAVAAFFLITTFVFQVILVDGSSMRNTLQDRERVFVTKFEYLLHDPERFDVVICNYPDRGDTKFVKRIVGVPGDVVAMRDGILYVNGEQIEEPYIDLVGNYNMQDTVVEEGHFFVMGDNRPGSNDSRNVGQLTRAQILGKVRFVIWPLTQMRTIR